MENEDQFQLISDEIKALHSIFCGEGEFLFNGRPASDTSVDLSCSHLVEGKIRDVQLSLQVCCAENIKLKLNLSLSKHYPNTIPGISVSSAELTKKVTCEIQNRLIDYARWNSTQCHEPYILKLVSWLQDNVPQWSQLCAVAETKPNAGNKAALTSDKEFIVVVKFDHMRSRKKYLKTVSSWMKELHLNGTIIFFVREIYAVFEGLKTDINKYLKRLRTCTVDVNSAGRSCKERMMDLLCEFEKKEQHRIAAGFQVVECSNSEELVKIFEKAGLSDVYQNYIKSFK